MGFVAAVFIIKKLIVVLLSLLLKYKIKTAHMAAFSLFQVGEFSLLLSTVGIQNEILTQEVYQLFLAVAIITMGITPFFIAKAETFTKILVQLPVPKKGKEADGKKEEN